MHRIQAELYCESIKLGGNDVLALSVGGATAGYRSDRPALDGNRNVVSCWDGSSRYSSAFAKLLWKVVFITLKSYQVVALRKEISEILKSSYLRGMSLASFFAVSKIMIFVTFITNDLLDNRITASQVFVVVMLFEALRFSSTLYFPMAVENVSEAVVSIQRIEKSGTPTLQDLFFTARPGELLAVVGPVGAGKGCTLSCSKCKGSIVYQAPGWVVTVTRCAGELPPSQGQVIVHGRIAYVPQQPWVFSGTVRSNILFGKKYEEDRYEEVIKACALEEDLQFLEDGDQTLIGDRGTPLSEGQKARVSLARAVYQDADIYLLDDPFSAVDAGVSRYLFEQYICQVLREKITILVTHQWKYLKAASWILILKGGTIVQCGTYTGLLKSGVDFDFLLKRNEEEPSPDLESSTLKNESRPLMRGAAPELQDTENIEVTLPLEDRLEGKVGIKTYSDYFTAGAQWFILIFLILVNIAAQVAYVLQDWWLAYWANLQSALYLGVYGKGETIVMLHLNWYLGAYSGRILNRFSKDIGHMDDLLPLIFQDFIQTFLLVVGVVGVMVAAIPWTAIPVIPLGIIFFVLRWYFLRTSRDVKRLECTTRSPVFSHVASSLRGLWTIRAYKAEQRFQELFDAYQDLHSDVICAIFATVVAFGALILVENLSSYTSTLSCHPPALPPQTTFFSTDLILTGLGELLREPEHSPKSTPAGAMGLSEPEGGVWIDGIRITRIGLHDLRKKMSVALQEPVLFTGTMRKNLDPYNEYLEEELWNVLEEVQLKEAIKALPSGLNTELAESGFNLSIGQRQLVCLARVVLRKNQILILDKATSNVDPRTDELIHKKIREKFAQCTVLTITHKLSTVIDCERILVLDSGNKVEYDEPYELLQDGDSLLYNMVQQLGEAEATVLTERAKQVYSEIE
ncbi:hypothetical protein JEQ12_002257 [Ovis aries]|uniref:Multidrug resistance-associated protein 4-like n=1 Tax=Ovis aries TaxID=9940 RepID=A0A836A6G4_SHEEP|nr:hypothetical protein JEQ12_002257 [Ovis aries]